MEVEDDLLVEVGLGVVALAGDVVGAGAGEDEGLTLQAPRLALVVSFSLFLFAMAP